MATEEHKKLANFIKATHNELRSHSRIYGPDEAWEKHLACKTVLQNYATAMQKLATEHWNDDKSEESGRHCRNKWIRSQCHEYFFNGGMEKFDDREIYIRNNKMDPAEDVVTDEEIVVESLESKRGKIKLLDVGSCYNPLGEDEMFEVTAIDLAPYSDRVLQCDFLNVRLGSETIISEDGRVSDQLKESSFDAVVFSLLLEYLPCPEQRYACCQKAYRLLKPSGVLLVVTPDSNHVGANAKIMKSWRWVLSLMGFMRIAYEKSRHLHCLAFRKSVDKKVAVRWAEMQIPTDNESFLRATDRIYIPQDFQTVADVEPRQNVAYDADELVNDFNELPGAYDT